MKQKIKNSGFTLIEVMVVVAIIGVLVGFAYPSYMEYVRKSNRADAKVALNDTAQRLQRCFTTYNAYNNANCGAATAYNDGASTATPEGFYSITAAINATTFTLTASPVAGTTQANDAKCTAFTLSHTGARGASGSDADNCW